MALRPGWPPGLQLPCRSAGPELRRQQFGRAPPLALERRVAAECLGPHPFQRPASGSSSSSSSRSISADALGLAVREAPPAGGAAYLLQQAAQLRALLALLQGAPSYEAKVGSRHSCRLPTCPLACPLRARLPSHTPAGAPPAGVGAAAVRGGTPLPRLLQRGPHRGSAAGAAGAEGGICPALPAGHRAGARAQHDPHRCAWAPGAGCWLEGWLAGSLVLALSGPLPPPPPPSPPCRPGPERGV